MGELLIAFATIVWVVFTCSVIKEANRQQREIDDAIRLTNEMIADVKHAMEIRHRKQELAEQQLVSEILRMNLGDDNGHGKVVEATMQTSSGVM